MQREKWSSSMGFILASIGSAVGIGNIWRFPYIVGISGGGAFLIPYLIAIFLFGLPLMILEFALGRHFRASVVPTFSTIGKRFRFAGFFIVFIMVMIVSYYLVITGWVLAYSLFFILGDPISFSLFTDSYYPLLFFLISGGISFLVVRAGVRSGIEKLSKLLIPILLIILLMLLVFSLSLPGAARGVEFYLTPDFSRLSDPIIWTAAFGQAFFSLSVGVGIMLTYGSYMRDENIVKSASIITVSDLLIAIIGGLVIFPIVFSFDLDPAAGVQLAFVTLPPVFQEMGFGVILGAMFFLLLFFAALTSAVSMMEVPTATLIDFYGFERKKATSMVSVIIIFIGLLSALSYTPLRLQLFSVPVFDTMDFVFGTLGIIAAGLVLSIIAGWFFDLGIICKDIGCSLRMQRFLMLVIKFFIPVILFVNLVVRVIGFV
ncbi:SNF family Na+-dependent transporter [Candidatus Methanoperedens nitroreducens]|uniref:Transporter n=1 Tax=Candidatus Methanoperedens nitratireducens TaxID=1392998 RepID=A0A062V149_9EURY|nr:sodium-dependent transporter [Candidatus Methanoperedens nitroreducens]KCZ72851.1 SNF family Na+-dependent transporter [Candidatus Methanoperedens nitroreducens]MDJ1423220.1 sodium-dependent transporter [Candidatus Methanoperedens sp.]